MIKNWLNKKPLWLKGGTIGALICILLFLFYIFAYFPAIDKIFNADVIATGGIPTWTLALPLLTGHFFPIMSGFFYGHPIIDVICKPEPGCNSWTAESGCVQTSMSFSGACEARAEMLMFLALTALLLIIYFAIGAIIGLAIQRKRNRA